MKKVGLASLSLSLPLSPLALSRLLTWWLPSPQEWILSDDEKKVKRDKIIENRRKKETGAPYGNLDTYSNSSVDEMTYSPEMKPSMKSMNSDLLNSNYSLSVSEGKGFFNSLYLLEQYQNQYQNFMSGKSPKESPTMAGPYSSGPIPKVPNHHSAGDVSPHGPSHNCSKSVDAVLRSPPPMAATSNSNPLLNGYQGIYPKGLEPGKHYGDYGYGPFSQHQQPPHHPHQHHSQHHPPQHRVPAMPGSSSSTHNHRPPHPPLPPPPSNGHLNGGGGGGGHHLMPTMPLAALEKPDTPIHALPSPFYQKCADSAELNRGHMSEISSNSSDSSYHFNPYYQEKNLAARSRSESQITSPEQQQLPNGKSPQVRLNGSTDSGFTKENGKCIYFFPELVFCSISPRHDDPFHHSLPTRPSVLDSNEYLSSDEENLSARGGGGGAPYAKDLNEDSNSVSNCDLRRPILATPAALPSSSGKNVHMEKLMGDSGSNSTGSSAANANTSRNSSSGTGEHTTSSSSSSSSGSNCNISSSIRTGSGGASVVKPSLSVYNFIEELRMQELSSACDLLRPWTRYRKVVHEMSQVNQMYEAVEQIINKVIEMSRMVTTFKDLCEMEQMALLKGAVTEMIILRSVLNYMPDKDSWVFNLLSVSDQSVISIWQGALRD